MSQVGPFLRKTTSGHAHWCPGCKEMHGIPDTWTFNGDLQSPSFSPSVRHTGKAKIIKDGRWTGEWHRSEDGTALEHCCHYFITDGQIDFCGDCTHPLSGQKLPLPPLPEGFRDD